jgi:phosphoribosylglycinamide formyltransferase-1
VRIGVLASHEGTVLQAVLDACAAGTIPGQVAIVISNNSRAGALRRATAAGVAVAHLSSATHPDADARDRAIDQALTRCCVDWVLLAGYMKRLGPRTLTHYQGRIINTHPSLLPKYGGRGFYGSRVHEAVLEAGESETGVSVHFVEGDYDTGRLIAQSRVPVEPTDTVATLEDRVKRAERMLLIDTLARFATEPDSKFA